MLFNYFKYENLQSEITHLIKETELGHLAPETTLFTSMTASQTVEIDESM